jgi:hypothetical protein
VYEKERRLFLFTFFVISYYNIIVKNDAGKGLSAVEASTLDYILHCLKNGDLDPVLVEMSNGQSDCVLDSEDGRCNSITLSAKQMRCLVATDKMQIKKWLGHNVSLI